MAKIYDSFSRSIGRGAMLFSLLGLVAALAAGCASSPSDSSALPAVSSAPPAAKEPIVAVDGLINKETTVGGNLFLREDHGIGGYDQFLIPEAVIFYRRGSRKLSGGMEQEFLATLEQTLYDAANDADVKIVREPARCAMQISLAIINVDLNRRGKGFDGTMTLAMEFRDSVSGETLLRYATENTIERADTPQDMSDLRRHFEKMVERLDIAPALEAAELADSELRPGCDGVLAQRGRSIRAAAAAREAQ